MVPDGDARDEAGDRGDDHRHEDDRAIAGPADLEGAEHGLKLFGLGRSAEARREEAEQRDDENGPDAADGAAAQAQPLPPPLQARLDEAVLLYESGRLPEARRRFEVLAREGVGGTSVRTICAEAGVSPGLLRHYFEGVDELIAAAYEAVSQRIAAAGGRR